MTDPIGLKLPLEIEVDDLQAFVHDTIGQVIVTVGFESCSVAEGIHRAKVIVAALTADEEPSCLPECCEMIAGGESRWLHVEECPNAEKEERDGC